MNADQQHCMRLVREADRNGYLATLYAPAHLRGALFALHAFGVEVSRIGGLVHEALPGEIRLQWWRDVIAAGKPTGNPVADALLGAIDGHRLPQAAFDQILEGWTADLYDDPMPDRTALEAWCGETFSTPMQVAAMILSPDSAPSVASMAGHAGCMLGIVWILQRLPQHRARGRCWIPSDILAAAGATSEALVAGDDSAQPAIAAMQSLAREHFAHFRREASGMPPAMRSAFLPVAAAEGSLDLLERSKAPLVNPRTLSDLKRQWLIWRRAIRGWQG